jgi:endoglucanase
MPAEEDWAMPTGRGGDVFLVCVVLSLAVATARPEERASPFEQTKRMGRGVNIIGYDPIWKSFDQARFRERHFRVIKEGGFETVRINLHAFAHMDPSKHNRLEPAWLSTLDWAVKSALAADLMVILDLHNFTDFAKDPVGLKPRFLAFWRQVAPRFKDAPDRVLFEILNEPNGKLTPALWDQYLHEALAIIRETNPTRTVVIGPPFWNGIDHMDDLRLPEEDRNIVVTVHYYQPMTFTHQGAPWNRETAHLSGVKWGTDEEKRKVEEDFGRVQQWSKAHDRPILLGEFGAYDKADMESRVRYTAHVARTAESLGWAWTYWQFDSDFVVYDVDKDRWVEPILRALVP